MSSQQFTPPVQKLPEAINKRKVLGELESKGFIVFCEPLAGWLVFVRNRSLERDQSMKGDFPSYRQQARSIQTRVIDSTNY
jgi:hypothetical protein